MSAVPDIKDHQVYIVTHIDKDHIHNHFVINSVNMENGNKLQISPKKLFKMKINSNKICEREGLTKIDINRKADIKKTMAELGMELRGITTWKDELRQCIDFARERTKNLEELKEKLESDFKISTRETKNSISFKHPEQNKSVRGKNLVNKYTKGEIENGFIGQEKGIRGPGEEQQPNQTTRAEHESENGVREYTFKREFGDIETRIRGIEQGVKENLKRENPRDNAELRTNETTSSGVENKQPNAERGHRTTIKSVKPKVHSRGDEFER